MRAILGSYDSELTPAEYSPQLTRRMREAEDMVQKVHAHSSEMEAQLSQALEELGNQKQRADMLEMELKVLQAQAGPTEQSVLLSREEASELRVKVEELEGERSRLEEDKRRLEAQLEHLTLQGDYDQSKTKVLHLSMNPAREAQQSRRQDQARLQEECEQLRKLVCALEGGGPDVTMGSAQASECAGAVLPQSIPGVEKSASVSTKEGRGGPGLPEALPRCPWDLGQRALQPLAHSHLLGWVRKKVPEAGPSVGPVHIAGRAGAKSRAAGGQARCTEGAGAWLAWRLPAQPRQGPGIDSGRVFRGPASLVSGDRAGSNVGRTWWVRELRKQVESAELRNQRLKEVFQAKVQEFRKVCYTLTGYQVDITRESQYRLTSMYAERQDDCLVFKLFSWDPCVRMVVGWRVS
ncbi:PREDICTED: mitotic spindle assembly checkpoint protein MAD1 [Myotis davidii]|uniref:mitotic spindle assembly checkpoint protein MAD1 n=1 Tax=Myotis davidii TaxID=225400 RepID=UPI000767C8E1|nr:PREDICTED: mitotic spindle assembly checkpoint protein MAD1 [Myotis davidii]